jgi:hypothetical protein
MNISDVLAQIPVPPDFAPVAGGLQFKDAAPIVCGVVDNGVCADDPRVLVRVNEATKIILDNMIPVGGMLSANITAMEGVLVLPPQMENVIEAFPVDKGTKVRNSDDIAQGWYEIVNNSAYLDPSQQYDNSLVDQGLWPAPWTGYEGQLVRIYLYPGLQPSDAVVRVTGVKRFVPLTNDEDFLIVQNLEALKCIILSVERYENNDPDGAQKYRLSGFDLLQNEVKKHILDPRNYMRRRAEYQDDLNNFAPDTMGWLRAAIALDLDQALRTGKSDLIWSLNQAERRLMQRGIFKDCVIQIQANVAGGYVYFPRAVGSVLAVDLDGCPIPVRSQFFQFLENGPGMFPGSAMLIDQGDEYFPATQSTRRKYKLTANCQDGQCINAVCKLRWHYKAPGDIMVIKNYEAMRLMMTAKFLEEGQKWNEAVANQGQAFEILERELQDYLRGIKHTPQIQTFGFGLGDIGLRYRV